MYRDIEDCRTTYRLALITAQVIETDNFWRNLASTQLEVALKHGPIFNLKNTVFGHVI